MAFSLDCYVQGSWPYSESADWALYFMKSLGPLLHQYSRDGSLWCLYGRYTQQQLCELKGERCLRVLAARSASGPISHAENHGLVWVYQVEQSHAKLLRPGYS